MLIRDGYTCQMCGAGQGHGRNLQVHHAYYSKRYENPWEYPVETLYTLCELCHPAAETIKQQIYERLAYLAPKYQHIIFHDIEALIKELASGVAYEPVEVDWATNKKDAT